MMALMAVWYNNFYGAESHAILPYDNRLERFPAVALRLATIFFFEAGGPRAARPA